MAKAMHAMQFYRESEITKRGAACGAGRGKNNAYYNRRPVEFTLDAERVTCKRCLRILNNFKQEEG